MSEVVLFAVAFVFATVFVLALPIAVIILFVRTRQLQRRLDALSRDMRAAPAVPSVPDAREPAPLAPSAPSGTLAPQHL